MSLNALLLAVRNTLRTKLTLAAGECEVMGGPQPPNRAGKRFWSVHPGGGWNCSSNESLDEQFGFQVTITLKAAEPPSDRVGTERLAKASTGILAYAEVTARTLHSSYFAMDAANDIIAATSDNAFLEPPRFRNAADAVVRGGEWFGGEGGGLQALSMTLTFREARRVRAIDTTVTNDVSSFLLEGGSGDRLLMEENAYHLLLEN